MTPIGIVRRGTLGCLAAVLMMAPAHADVRPAIDEFIPDYAGERVFIVGRNFGSSMPAVSLAGMPVVVTASSGTLIEGAFDFSVLTPGDYPLIVQTGDAGSGVPKATALVTVGATGPKGEAGEPGPAGEQGAPGISGYQIVQSPLTLIFAEAVCPGSMRALGGGCDSGDEKITLSRPRADGRAWQCRFDSDSGGILLPDPPDGFAFAICANVE